MSFIQTGFLLAGAAVAIPVIVHLLNRWQVRRIELGTMRFLGEIIRDGAQRRKIRRWLLLLVRMALIALLAVLFARPFLAERVRRDGDRLCVVLVDRSASMGMPGKNGRLIDDAISAAVEQVQGLGEDAKVLWAWFDRAVEPMADSIQRPSPPRTVAGETNYLAALEWARDRIHAFPEAIADVVLVTDLQQTGLVAESLHGKTLGFPSEVPVRIIDVGRPAANNLALMNLAPPATRLELDEPVTLTATLFNFGTLPFDEVPLSVLLRSEKRTVRLKKSVDVPSGQAEEVSLDFGKLEAGVWQATVSMDIDDDLAADNQRLTAVEVARPMDVLVIDSGSQDDGYSAESYYVTTALVQREHDLVSSYTDTLTDSSALGAADTSGDLINESDMENVQQPRARFNAQVVYLDDDSAMSLSPDRYPLVVVADAASLVPVMLEQLERYVRSGGRLLVFAGDGHDRQASGEASGSISNVLGTWEQTGLAPGEFSSPQRSGVTPFRIVSLGENTPMLAPFVDPQHGDLSRLAFRKLLPVQPTASTRVLAWFDHEQPAVTEHTLGSGQVVWFLSSADASWSSWTTSPLYLPLVQQMARELLNLTGEGPIRFRLVGDSQPLIASQPGPRDGNAQVQPVAYHDDSPQSAPLTFNQPGFEQTNGTLFVVNGSSRESDPTRTEPALIAEHYGLTLAHSANEVVGARVTGERRREYWPWLAAAALVLLVGEFALANRTSA